MLLSFHDCAYLYLESTHSHEGEAQNREPKLAHFGRNCGRWQLAVLVSLAARFARRSADSMCSCIWRLASLDFRRTRCARVFGSSLRSTFGGLNVLVSLAARFARLSADSLCSCLWRLASLDFRRARCARVFGGSLLSTVGGLDVQVSCSTFGGRDVLVSLVARFARLSADSL